MKMNKQLIEALQNQPQDYLNENNVKEISLDGNVIWRDTTKKIIIGPHCLTSY